MFLTESNLPYNVEALGKRPGENLHSSKALNFSKPYLFSPYNAATVMIKIKKQFFLNIP